jgi:hypothetical protein
MSHSNDPRRLVTAPDAALTWCCLLTMGVGNREHCDWNATKRKTPGSGELSRVFVLRVAWIKVSAEALTLTGIGSLTITYFHTGIRTIIGVESFHGPVRDGKGWYRLAMVIRHDLLL